LSSVGILTALALNSLIQYDDMRFGGWLMFAGYGADVCIVEYFSAENLSSDSTSRRTPINRFRHFGYHSVADAPNSLRIIRSIPQALEIGKRLCSSANKSIVTELTCVRRDRWQKLASQVLDCQT
jgi:hypothetical protein